MKLIKLGIISVVILFSIITLIGLLFPSKIIVSRTTEIIQKSDTIFALTKDLYGWQKWVKSLQNQHINSSTQTTLGKSTIIITSSSPQKICGKWVEKNGDEQLITISIIPSQNISIVNWQFEEKIKWYPWARLSSMINESVIGNMMEGNLAALKQVAEKSNELAR
jgi:hypothetical protein